MSRNKMDRKPGAEWVGQACDNCGGGNIGVLDTRSTSYNNGHVRRRRECLDCGTRFTTYEISKQEYQDTRDNILARHRAFKMVKDLQDGKGLDRFKNLDIISRSEKASEKWNDREYVESLEYGAMLALIAIFGFTPKELKQ